MTKPLAALVAAAILAAAPVRAGEHLISSREAQERLLDRTTARARDLATVMAFVGSAEATTALATTGLDAARLQGSLAALDDDDLQEIAARVAALEGDPVAGAAFTGKQVGIGAAIVLIVVFIIILA